MATVCYCRGHCLLLPRSLSATAMATASDLAWPDPTRPDCRPGDKPDVRRFRSMQALLAMCPYEGGDALLAEVYSPHLDTYQRLLILDTLGAAAQVHAWVGRLGGGGLLLSARAAWSCPPYRNHAWGLALPP